MNEVILAHLGKEECVLSKSKKIKRKCMKIDSSWPQKRSKNVRAGDLFVSLVCGTEEFHVRNEIDFDAGCSIDNSVKGRIVAIGEHPTNTQPVFRKLVGILER
jgi:hypothetical protein